MSDNEPTPRCALASCRAPFLPSQPGQRYCSRRHARTAEKQRQREREKFGETVRELVSRQTGAYDTDPADLDGDEHQDDETGIVAGDSAPDPWQQRNDAWADRMAHADAVEAIRARYERLLAPHRETMKRNIGVKPAVVARLEAQRDAEIRELTRARQLAEAYELAARMAPQRAVQAAERQQEQAALNAFGRDLMGGSRRYQPPDWTGRATPDIAIW